MGQDDQPPRLFSSLVHTQESSYDGDGIEKSVAAARERKTAAKWDEKSKHGPPPRPANATETLFRHSGWAKTRLRVLAALYENEESESAIDRFTNCGAACDVHVSTDGQRAKLCARYCKSRFCVPCMKAKARTICDRLNQWCDGVDPLMITLTQRDDGKPLSVLLDHLLKSFARLRASQGWRDKIDAGAYCVEITRGKNKDHWHCHLHAICIGGYYPHSELSAAWAVASRGSTVVHVTRASTATKGISYAAEYASKGWSSECLESVELVCELLDSLRSRRLLGTFGGWRGLSVEADEIESGGYRRVGCLVEIVNHAAGGEQWAIGILRLIGVAVVAEGGQVSFVRSKRFPNPREEERKADPGGAIPRGHGL